MIVVSLIIFVIYDYCKNCKSICLEEPPNFGTLIVTGETIFNIPIKEKLQIVKDKNIYSKYRYSKIDEITFHWICTVSSATIGLNVTIGSNATQDKIQ